jgi:CRP-like cAMP-binding protein
MVETTLTKAGTTAPLREVGWLARQPAAFQDAVLEMGLLKPRQRSSYVYRAAQRPTALFAVVHGAVRIHFPLQHDEFLLYIGQVGFWFGEAALVTGRPRIVSVSADTDCLLLEVPERPLTGLLARQPEHWRSLADLASQHLELAMRIVAETLNLPPAPRIARRLLDRVDAGASGRVEIALSQADLAALVGLSRQRLNWHLQEMANAGLLESRYGRIVVTKVARLRELADGV